MSRYTLEKSGNSFVIKKGSIAVVGVPDFSDALIVSSTLEDETAPLHAEIERLQAENAKMKAGIAEISEVISAVKIHEHEFAIFAVVSDCYAIIHDMQESEADNA